MKYLLLLLLNIPIFGWIKAYSQEWIPINLASPKGEAIQVEIIESNPYTIKAKFSVNGIYDYETSTKENGLFHRLSFENGSNMHEIGEPSLPFITQLIAIPSGSSIRASIIDEVWTKINVGKVYPAQKPHKGEQTPDFQINESSYAKPYIPTKVSIGKENKWRSAGFTSVLINPFRYYPDKDELDVMKTFTLQVSLLQGNIVEKNKFGQQEEKSFHFIENNLFTESNKGTLLRSNNTNTYDYLIIVGSGLSQIANSDEMTRFRIWKALKGHKTDVVTIPTGSTSTSIKSIIANEYNNGVRYVLFVGDTGDVPTCGITASDNTIIYSDYWYGCLSNNDAIADIPIGRFPISSLDDFGNMVEKTIKYESTYNASTDVLLVAHLEDAPQGYQLCCEQIRTYPYTNTMYFIKDYGAVSNYGCEGTDATNSSVINHINGGAHIINYRGHGGANYWGNPYWNYLNQTFSDTQISALSNDVCAVFFSIACSTGDITNQTCFLETFLRAQKGAVAFIGSTDDTDTYANDEYDKNLFKALLHNAVYKIGDINMTSQNANIISSNYYGVNKDVAYSYIVGGDPTLEIWTGTPQSIGNVDVVASNGSITVNTGLSGGYNVSISSTNGNHIQTLQPTGSSCTFTIPANKFYISIYKHNYSPKIIYYDSVTNSIVNMRFNYDAYYTATPLDVHTEIASSDEEEGTIVKSGNKLVIMKGSGGVTIQEDFECENGAVFEIK